MTTDLVRAQLSRTLKVKTLEDLVRAKTSEDLALLLDVSGSMSDRMRNGKERIDGLRETVKDIQQSKKDIKMIAFGGYDREYGGNRGRAYVVNSVPNAAGGTPLRDAIELARTMKLGRVIVISDGMPENPPSCIEAAREFGGRIDVVFVGDPGEHGEQFLKELAEASGGTQFNGDLSEPKELSGAIVGLLNAGTDLDDEDDKKVIRL